MGQARLEHARELKRRADTHLASAGWLSARELYQDALAVYREEEDGEGQAQCLRGLGDVALKLKEPAQAEQLYREGLELCRAGGQVLGVAEAIERLGDLHRLAERWDEARTRLEEAARAYEDAGHKLGVARCHGLLGEVERLAGADAAEVMDHYQAARDLQLASGDLRGAAVTLGFMANYLKDLGQLERAAQVYAQTAELYDGLGLHHRAAPFRTAARRLDPTLDLPDGAAPKAAWDED